MKKSLVLGGILCLAFGSFAQAQTDEQVTAARLRGVEFIKQKQKPDGSWDFKGHDVGITALCTIALIENGIPLADPIVQKGYDYVKKNVANEKNTYELSLAVVMLSRIGDRRDKPQIKTLAARLIAGQMDSGGWHYTCPGQELDAEKILRDPGSLPKPKEGYGDNSCTQFAVLGLWVASRTGINVDRTLNKVAQRFVKTQLEDGGWAYVMDVPKPANAGANDPAPKPSSGPSMTGAGLFCLAVAQANQIREFQKSGKKGDSGQAPSHSLLEDPVFSRGFKRTGDFVKGIGPGSPRYFLWSVERVGVLLGLDKMADTDWFLRGADALLKTQKEDGGWPPAWTDTDKDGLSDTAFALLFLRKANLGSDISRLLEGEAEQKFEVVGRKPVARFDSLEAAIDAAKAGETIRIDGPGPYKVGHLELKKDLTIQAGFGYTPVFKYEVGKNRLGIKLKPETDDNARDMFAVAGGKVTLEGIKLQMDPPVVKQPVPWRAITVQSGSLRLLNCTVSETNKQGTVGVMIRGPGQNIIRNSLFIGGKAGIEIVGNDKQELIFDNSIVFSNAGIVLSNDAKSKEAMDAQLQLVNAVFQTKEAIQAPKLTGNVVVNSHLSVFQSDSISLTLSTGAGNKGRSWKGSLNLYDVKQWIGTGGKALADVKDLKSWQKLWGNTETDAFARIAPFIGLRQVGNFSHESSPQDWQLELPADADSLLQKSRVGVNSYLAGPGSPFDQYRETIAYSDWLKGKLDLTGLDPAGKKTTQVATPVRVQVAGN